MKHLMTVGLTCIIVLLNSSLFATSRNLGITSDERKNSFLIIYDFNGTTYPSSHQKACFIPGVQGVRDGPPPTGPDIENATEFTTSDYVKIYKPDDANAETSSVLGRPAQYFQFTVNEEIADIRQMFVHWYGHASSTPVDLYIWNYNHTAWELVGVDRITKTDQAISKTYINDIAQYFEPAMKHLSLVAIARTMTLAPQTLYTNYIQIKVGNPSTTTLQDDAYHYHGENMYVEWWFFQVINLSKDVQFYLSYYVMNPERGFAALNMGVFEQGDAYEITKIFPVSVFAASYETPEVTLGDCSFHAVDDTTFVVKGSADDTRHSAAWNLTFIRTTPAYDFKESPGETQYLCYLPGAWVNGTMILNGVTYSMNHSYGYHDHNWGGAPHLLCQWAWSGVCDPAERFAFVMEKVEHFTWHTRSIFMSVGNETFYFEDIQTTFQDFTVQTRHIYPFFTYYPRLRHIHATNDDGYVLSLNATVQKNLPIWFGIPHTLNEQVSLFQGTLSKEGQTLYSFQVLGFTDYSTY
jgi:hypothetical protein